MLIIEVKNNEDLVDLIFDDSNNTEFTHNYSTPLENFIETSKSTIEKDESFIFDANSDVEINSNDSKTSLIDEDSSVKPRRFAASDVNYKTLQNS